MAEPLHIPEEGPLVTRQSAMNTPREPMDVGALAARAPLTAWPAVVDEMITCRPIHKRGLNV